MELPKFIILLQAERKIVEWICEEWDSDWNLVEETWIEGKIDFKISPKSLEAMISKGYIKEALFYKNVDNGESEFRVIFNPQTVLKLYNGFDYSQFKDPNGHFVLEL